jgi:hypothetical protein
MNDRNLIQGKGRPKGTPNKINTIAKEHFSNLLNGNLEQINKDIAELKPYERLKILLEITSYILPKLKAVEVTEVKQDDFEPIVLVYERE